jgi:hypothetical protein
MCRRAIRSLQGIINAKLSGDDSVLAETWDEVCVQVQYEHWSAWDAYEETIRATIRHDIESLPQHDAQAIWLQTDQGFDWARGNEGNMQPLVCDDDIEDYMLREFVLAKAGSWSNARIRKYVYR